MACYSSCQAIYAADSTSTDGMYNICFPGLNSGNAFQVYCLMSYGQRTAMARVVEKTGGYSPPYISSSAYSTWAEWSAHSWSDSSTDSYYLPLDYFDTMAGYATEFVQLNRNSGGTPQEPLATCACLASARRLR